MAVPLLLRPLKQGTRTTVKNPQRKAFPGIYRDPRIIVAEAAQRVPPENPLMFDLFGVTRSDLDQMAFAKRGTDQGALEVAQPTKRSSGAASAKKVMTKANEQRMIDLLEEARREAKFTGSSGWYESEPLLLEFMYELGPDEGKAAFDRWTQISSALSPGASVPNEIKRASLAYMMDRQGRLFDFYDAKIPGLELDGDYGHIYHTGAHKGALQRLDETGSFLSPDLTKQSKTRDYVQARFGNTKAFAGDAHDARRYGLADTRTSQEFGGSMENPEKQTLRPFHSKISDAVDLDETPAQALGWNVGGTSTGVESPLGVPYMELVTESVGKTAAKRGDKPKEALGSFIRGEKPLLGLGGATITATALMPDKSYASAVGPDGYYNSDAMSVPLAALYEEPKSAVRKFYEQWNENIGGTRGLADMLLMGAAVVPSPIQIPAIAIESGLLARDAVNWLNEQEPIDPSERFDELMMSP